MWDGRWCDLLKRNDDSDGKNYVYHAQNANLNHLSGGQS